MPRQSVRVATPEEATEASAPAENSTAPQDKKAYMDFLKALSSDCEFKLVVKLTRKHVPYAEATRSGKATLEKTLGLVKAARDKLLSAYNTKLDEDASKKAIKILYTYDPSI